MKVKKEYKPGDNYRGYTVLAISEKVCDKHGCNKLLLLRKSKIGRAGERHAACIECRRESDKNYWQRRAPAPSFKMPHYKCGTHHKPETLWSPKADKKIKEFWAARGMEDPTSKLWPKRRKYEKTAA